MCHFHKTLRLIVLVLLAGAPPMAVPSVLAQTPAPPPVGAASAPAASAVPGDYVIGPEDVLSVVFWTAKEMSHEVLVQAGRKNLAATHQRRSRRWPDTPAVGRRSQDRRGEIRS